ncbi:bacteriohemerythrin [Proteocatella sphenisci]|uniref:bacteriohemerythrin n=1 Tax=Proteocatella sphenisci TaxID=181070 RepID=UPI00049096DC|nr:hemerythrin family protein [Proteocatella sphenisci]
MAFKWKDSLTTGNTTIDSQHKELVNAANELLEACSQGKGREEIVRTGKFLLGYTKKHFGDEERLQLKSKYPDYDNHKKLHEILVKEVNNLVSDLESQGPTVVLVGKINNLISGWVFDHISREDIKVATHIKNS